MVALIALGFVGVSAMIGGIPFDPPGATLTMPLSLLAHSRFHNFLIPGILLFTANGLLSIVVIAATLRREAATRTSCQ